jgi:hypothetical protein
MAAAMLGAGGPAAAMAAAMAATAAMLGLGGLAAALAVAAAPAALLGRDGRGEGEGGDAGEQDEVTHEKTPLIHGNERVGCGAVPAGEARFVRCRRSTGPAWLNGGCREVNAR